MSVANGRTHRARLDTRETSMAAETGCTSGLMVERATGRVSTRGGARRRSDATDARRGPSDGPALAPRKTDAPPTKCECAMRLVLILGCSPLSPFARAPLPVDSRAPSTCSTALFFGQRTTPRVGIRMRRGTRREMALCRHLTERAGARTVARAAVLYRRRPSY